MATMYYRPYSTQPIKDGELPPHDALENILPEYQYIFVDPHPRVQPPGRHLANQPDSPLPHTSDTFQGIPETRNPPEDMEVQAHRLLDYQMQELEKYRLAVRTMGQDILMLRQQIRELEVSNSQLRSKLTGYNDVTQLMVEADEVNSLDRTDMEKKYGTLKRKLNEQTSELRDYKERVRDLQNHLIKKNDSEKDLLQLSTAHEGQQELLQKLQEKAAKVKKLENACKKQELVIEKMEKLLSSRSQPEPFREGNSLKEANTALAEENRRLKAEVREAMNNSQGRRSQEEVDGDHLGLLERLERAETRIMSLERKLSDNAKNWAREKSDLMTKLRDAEYGFNKPSSPLYNSYPKIKPHKEDDLWTSNDVRQPRSKVPATRKSYPGKGKGPPLRY